MSRSGRPPGSIPHLPALDGLRGLALLGVLFFHSNKLLPGGYLGVDLFFVLSGYLITSLLLAEHRDTGKIALKEFWIRRARRLFPALLSLIPAVAAYCRFVAQPDELARVRGDALATLGYVANWRAIFSQKSYWELFAAPSPLEHTWSLAIEEQFYVIWPLVVFFLLRRKTGSPRSILVLSVVLAVCSIAASLLLFDPAKSSRVYLGTDTRATSILAGAALATLLPPATSFTKSAARRLDLLGVASAIGLAFAWWRLEGKNPFLYKGGFWITELGCLSLIACAVCGTKSSYVARALAWKPLTWVGMISYGLYLWHWPVNVFLSGERFHGVGNWIRVIQFAVSFAIAIVSYKFFEQPIRRRGLPFGKPLYVVPAAVGLCVLLIVGATRARPASGDAPNRAATIGDPSEISSFAEPTAEAQFKVLLVGDSTANSLGWTMRGVHKRGVTIDMMGKDGCTMLWDTCNGDKWADTTKAMHPNATLFFVGGAFMHGIGAKDGQWVKACHAEWDEKFTTTLTRRLADLLGPKTRVWAVTLPYGLGPWGGDDFRAEVDCINADITKSASAVPGVKVLDLNARLCPKGVCERESNGAQIRPDGAHYDMKGANELSRWILDQLLKDPAPPPPSTPSAPLAP